MAGLSVLLETKVNSPTNSRIVNKTVLLSSTSATYAASDSESVTSSFLEYCYLCRKKLRQGYDIYMYRGDKPFCSEKCRYKQISIDESRLRNPNSMATTSLAGGQRSPASRQQMAYKGRMLTDDFTY